MTRARVLAGFVTAINVSNDLFVGVVTGTSFIGDGTGLTGVASTDYIITGTAATFNNTVEVNNNFSVSGTTSLTGNVDIISTDAESSAAPELKLYRNSSSPADADYLGQIKFAGESDTGVERNYAKITGKIGDASNGTEDGIIEVAHIKAGSQNISGRWTSSVLKLLNETSLEVAGDATVTGDVTATDFNSTSDINKKKNLREVVDSLEILKGIRGVRFDWVKDDSPSVGVIAQEVEQVLPELVTEIDGIKTVNYNGLVGVLIEAVKDLKSEIEELKRTR